MNNLHQVTTKLFSVAIVSIIAFVVFVSASLIVFVSASSSISNKEVITHFDESQKNFEDGFANVWHSFDIAGKSGMFKNTENGHNTLVGTTNNQ